MGEKLRSLALGRRELASELGREPTDDELSIRLGWSEEEVRFATTLLSDAGRLDRPVSAERGAAGISEYIADERASRVAEEEVVEEAETALLFEALAKLPDRLRRVLIGRHGLDGGEPATLRELAEVFEVSCERVRQMQREAERKLRSFGTVVTPAKRGEP